MHQQVCVNCTGAVWHAKSMAERKALMACMIQLHCVLVYPRLLYSMTCINLENAAALRKSAPAAAWKRHLPPLTPLTPQQLADKAQTARQHDQAQLLHDCDISTGCLSHP